MPVRAVNPVTGRAGTLRLGDIATIKREYVDPPVTKVRFLAEVRGSLTPSGGETVMEKSPISETSWWATFRDPDGNVVGLYEGTTDAG